MFYDRFMELCKKAGVTPAKVAEAIGINKSTMYMWKKQGTTPKYETISKLSNYFDVSVDYLQGKTDALQESNPKKPTWRIRVDVTPESREFSDLMKRHEDGTITVEERARLIELGVQQTEALKRALEEVSHAFEEIFQMGAQGIERFVRYVEYTPEPHSQPPECKDTHAAEQTAEEPTENE